MALLSMREVTLGFGGPNLLNGVNLQIETNERLCLLGRNGEGKSTLMKLIAGLSHADSGHVEFQQSIKVAYLTQDVPADIQGTVYDVVASGVDKVGELLKDYHHVTLKLTENCDDKTMAELERIQHELEACDVWLLGQQIETTISRLQLPMDEDFSALSGGLKRRVLLAKALVVEPDLLLLDEPTNHLDIAAIGWLEEFLKSWQGSVLFVTHDREFLRNLATRIIELDRGKLTSWPGNYDTYLKHKEEALHAEEKENALFDKKLAQEETWIRQGIKARRTRNEGRVRALKSMRDERTQRRDRKGNVKMEINDKDRSGKIVIEAENVSFSYKQQPIVKNLNLAIMRGDRIGIIGPNGVGKTTLIQILLGENKPDEGCVKTGTKLEVAYFDQHREDLDDKKSVRENLAPGTDNIEINGRSKHVMSYLNDFLFPPQRANSPVSSLSGGERNRLMLAKLFAKPFNFLVMDEPTNDLDVETLELLEELLLEYKGTLLLVSHDRAFLNNVVTSTLVYEGEAQVNEYVGGYDDWLSQRAIPDDIKIEKKSTPKLANTASKKDEKKTQKLSYKDQRELDALPKLIEILETEIAQINEKISAASFYQQDKEAINKVTNRLAQAEAELEQAYERWDILEES